MSVVAVKVYETKIVIGADSFVSFNYDTQLKDKEVKLFQHANGVVVGGVGYAKDISLFRLFTADRKPARADDQAIIEYLVEFISWAKEKVKDYSLNTDFMIVFGGRVWFISSDFYLKEITDHRAMGAGMNMAQTALYLGKSIEEALDVATELSIYCEKPLNIVEVKR